MSLENIGFPTSNWSEKTLDGEIIKSKSRKYPGLNCPFPICQKTFRRKDAYKRHVAMVHNNADSRFNKRLKKILNNTK
ncbi:CBM_collapsed_G0024380.mRNA.1.CDS.1 [Saccharomyces cerevisiae]|nr:CBM_collapsed_G0024380.mRNA.1.CDS.1 [Saccharomyces cerevisiae]